MSNEKEPVIIYGGSFNPPHSGHISLAKAAYRQIKPKAFYFVPNFHSPFKEMQPASFNDRRNMLQIAAGENFMNLSGVQISSWEEDQKKIVYTWKTIAHFRRIHPNAKIYFLMGSDCLKSFNDWQRSRSILRNASLLVGIRPGFNIVGGEAPFVPLKGTDISECVELSKRVAQRIWDELKIPSFLYEESCTREERRNLTSKNRFHYR